MGSGFKDFAAGDVLTAADVDGYLMRQTVMTFADASARDTALSGVLDEGMVAYLEDVNALTVYNGSAWVAVIDSDVLTVDTANNRVGINDATPSYALDVTGDINATGDLRIGGTAIGEWTTFTPTFNNVTLGASGSVVGRYTEVNDLVFYSAKFDLGGTGSIGGQISLTPPAGTADSSTDFAVAHQAWYRPDGGTIFHGMGFASVANIYFYAYALSGSYQTAPAANATTPITWTSAGIFYCQGWYAKV